ncbi:MAG: DUF4440 domain-containing protein [Betaproteobacteria bacterium]|nr:DUF4440 domain-containing protein [Betaproteobacteria bacterium]
MKNTTFPTPQDAESAFYEALESSNLEAMMEVWAEDEEVICVHPGGPRLAGLEQVRESWARMFGSGQRMRIHLSHQVVIPGMMLAVHSVHENIQLPGESRPRPPAIATNVYLRIGNGWRMIAHHASPAPQGVRLLVEARVEGPAEGPKVFH